MLLCALALVAALAPQAPPPPAPAEVAPVTETTAPATEGLTMADAPSLAVAQNSIGAGLVAYRKRRFAAAETEFRKACIADPASAAGHYYLGYTIYKQAERKGRNAAGKREALEEFSKAFSLQPTFRPTWGVANR
jgi:tetratricopeptide (TPR) repeat protein